MTVEDVITAEATVPAPAGEAHLRFACRTSAWWPSSYAWAPRDPDVADLRSGACAFGPTLFVRGGVLHVFGWQAGRAGGAMPCRRSVVAVRFDAVDRWRTRIRLAHAGVAAAGPDGWFEWAALSSAEGWAGLMLSFAASWDRAPSLGNIVPLRPVGLVPNPAAW